MSGQTSPEDLTSGTTLSYLAEAERPFLPSTKQDLVDEPDDGYHKASFSSAVFNLSTTIVGAGIMSLPATMKVLGLIPGLLTLIISGILTERSLHFLIKFTEQSKARSYGGLMALSFGKSGKLLTQLCILINNFGMTVVYLIIIGDVLSGARAGVESAHDGLLVQWAGGPTWWNGRIFVLAMTTLLVLAPLASFRHVDSLKHSSALSVALALVFVVITIAIALTKLVDGTIDPPQLWPNVYNQASFWRLFTAVPVMVTAYICHHNLHPIANEMQGSLGGKLYDVSQLSIIFCSVLYVATALFGYLLFGDKTSSDILANFDADLNVPYSRLLCDIVRISYAVHIMLVFPLLNFSLRLNLDLLLFPKARPLADSTRRFAFMTFVLIVAIFIGSTVIPNIWVAFEFTGATASVCIGFIFPGLIALRNISHVATRRDKWFAAIMVTAAIISSVSAITTNLLDLLAREHQPDSGLHGIYSYTSDLR